MIESCRLQRSSFEVHWPGAPACYRSDLVQRQSRDFLRNFLLRRNSKEQLVILPAMQRFFQTRAGSNRRIGLNFGADA